MGEETFSAIFEDFMKASAAVLYQFSLSTEPFVLRQVPTGRQSNPDHAPGSNHHAEPVPQKQARRKKLEFVTEIDNYLIKHARRSKHPLHSSQFLKGAVRMVNINRTQVRKRLVELKKQGRLKPKD
jgi:hypothetical protein